jgi:outer membrane biosynthesis protein TonB
MPTKITELFDVDVQTVGLVKRGANKKRWFLMKSQEDNMADEKDVLESLNEIEQVEEGDLEIKHVRTLASVLKGFFGMITEKPEPEPEPEPEPPDESDLEARMDELEKAHKTQLEQAAVELQKAQDEAAEARKEAAEALEKADAITEAKRKAELEPIAKAAGMETDMLYGLEKASPEAFEAVVTAFEAKDKQLEEAGFWAEKGSSQTGEQETSKRILERATALEKSDGLSREDALVAATVEMGNKYDEYREQLGRQRI